MKITEGKMEIIWIIDTPLWSVNKYLKELCY